MRKLLAFIFLFLPLCLLAQKDGSTSKFSLPKPLITRDYVPGIIILKLKAGTGGTSSRTLQAKQFSSVKSANILSIRRKFEDNNEVGSTLARGSRPDVGLDRIYEVILAPSANLQETINQFLRDNRVEYAEPLYIHHASYNPSDPRYLSGGQPYLSIIKAPQAWEIVRNSSEVIIAIIDSGSELTHPDLAANIYYNAADPINGNDDDGDGFTDNYAGWDFVGPSGTNIQPDNNPNVISANNQHGVHVSGIASAVTDNGVGVASTAFNAKLLIVKAGPDNNGEDIYRGYEAIKYAADKGAHVINCSWGSTSGGAFGRDIVNYAISKGSLIIAAAGNSGSDTPEYPAAYRGVIAVANTENSDEKAGSSSFGNHVVISAPGTSILSTTYGNTYGSLSGTSMASPVVASAAALVKRAFPELNMQQVGERLRVTADNIDAQNGGYAGKLGRGRLNVLAALTQSSPSIRIQNISQVDNMSSNGLTPDTVEVFLDLKNFLSPATGIELRLIPDNLNLSLLNPQLSIAGLNTLEERTQVGPFRILIPATIENNTNVQFRLEYRANNGTYLDYENFTLVVARDYIDIHTPSISTTITSKGKIGYSSPDQEGGLGFIYKGEQMLYEAALMIGNSATRVANNARAVGDETDDHFVKLVKAHELINNADSVVAEAEFNDNNSPVRLNIRVTNTMRAYKQAPNDKFAIIEYEIKNTTNTALQNVRVGLFTDWDILGGSNNATQYDPALRLGYVYDKQASAPYAGIKLLSQNASPIYYPLTFKLTGNPLSDDDLTIAEKWETLSSGVKALEMGTNTSGIDVSFVSGLGPYTINANSSIKVAFAALGGDNLADIRNSALAAQQKYDLISTEAPVGDISRLDVEVYPNPVVVGLNNLSEIRVTVPEDGLLSIDLVNLQGQKLKSLVNKQQFSRGIHTFNYDYSSGPLADVVSGIYIYKVTLNGQLKSKKVSILR